MRWRDVGDATIVVDAEKTGQRRVVRLLAPLAQDLRQWPLASGRPGPAALVFPAADGTRVDGRGASRGRRLIVSWQAVNAAGVEHASL